MCPDREKEIAGIAESRVGQPDKFLQRNPRPRPRRKYENGSGGVAVAAGQRQVVVPVQKSVVRERPLQTARKTFADGRAREIAEFPRARRARPRGRRPPLRRVRRLRQRRRGYQTDEPVRVVFPDALREVRFRRLRLYRGRLRLPVVAVGARET